MPIRTHIAPIEATLQNGALLPKNLYGVSLFFFIIIAIIARATDEIPIMIKSAKNKALTSAKCDTPSSEYLRIPAEKSGRSPKQ